jgi:ribonuclease HII
MMPSLEVENKLLAEQRISWIAGVDEAGRGAIAGPVVAAAVILPLHHPARLDILSDVNDSKQLTSKMREELFDLILSNCVSYGIGSASAAEVDQYGIIPANARAMRLAVAALEPAPQYLLVDGRMRIKNLPIPQRSIIRGDSLSLSIAAASILAKVSRDRLMSELDHQYPHYLFAKHKGYCTIGHKAALSKYGSCTEHRHSFAPIRKRLL